MTHLVSCVTLTGRPCLNQYAVFVFGVVISFHLLLFPVRMSTKVDTFLSDRLTGNTTARDAVEPCNRPICSERMPIRILGTFFQASE